jgi:hypothetical protein
MALLVVMATAGSAQAGFFHFNDTLNCEDCHTMHFSQQHGNNPAGTGIVAPLGTGGPFAGLLRDDINELCLTCHDGQTFAPDVLEDNNNTAAGGPRQAGALNKVGGNGIYPPPTGHTLGSTDTAPGGTWSDTSSHGLNCANCHAAHGGGLAVADPYRNLGGFGTAVGPSTQVSFAPGSSNTDLTVDVFVNTSSGVTLNKYQQQNVTYNEPNTADSAIAAFCKGCHTDFHGAVGDATTIGGTGTPPTAFIRHPAAGVDIGAIGGGHSSLSVFTNYTNQVQVMSPTGQAAGAYDGSDTGLTPTCISCHKGHGNQNAFGLIYIAGTGTVDEEGDSGTSVRDLCNQCHAQGG